MLGMAYWVACDKSNLPDFISAFCIKTTRCCGNTKVNGVDEFVAAVAVAVAVVDTELEIVGIGDDVSVVGDDVLTSGDVVSISCNQADISLSNFNFN